MTVTCWGTIATADGVAWWTDDIPVAVVDGRTAYERRHSFSTLPAANFYSEQPSIVPVDLGHGDHQAGQVIHLERGEDGAIVAVAVLPHLTAADLEAFGRPKFSTQTAIDRDTGGVELRSVALVAGHDAATVGLQPIRWIPGDIRYGALANLPIGNVPKILERAVDSSRRRHYGDPLKIEQPVLNPVKDAVDERARIPSSTDYPAHYSPGRMGPVEHSTHRGRVISVRW